MQTETFEQAKKLLVSLIETFSISRQESGTAELLCKFFKKRRIICLADGNHPQSRQMYA